MRSRRTFGDCGKRRRCSTKVSKGGSLIDPEHVREWLGKERDNPWWALLCEAFDTYRAETLNTLQWISLWWLAEWGRDARRRQRGLMLLTAHRAKGLEFDHVVVDGWDKVGEEDREAPRRLYYVAMTRARETLTLARQLRGTKLVVLLVNEACALEREPVELPKPPKELARRYEKLSLSDVDIGFAGRQETGSAVHRSIAKLVTGDSLTLSRDGTAWELRDAGGATVGRLAKRFKPPEDMHCIDATVTAVVVWCREWTDPARTRALRSMGGGGAGAGVRAVVTTRTATRASRHREVELWVRWHGERCAGALPSTPSHPIQGRRLSSRTRSRWIEDTGGFSSCRRFPFCLSHLGR